MAESTKKITITYESDQYLAKITEIGAGEPALTYFRRYESFFDGELSIALPDRNDIKDFDTKRKINWQFKGDLLDENPTLTANEKKLLHSEKDRLVKYCSSFEENSDDFFIINEFSFDWDNPEGNVIRTTEGLTLINYGMYKGYPKPLIFILKGIVKSNNGEPIHGARIVIDDTSSDAETNADGSYAIKIKSGKHKVKTSASGYKSATKEVNISENETILNFELPLGGEPPPPPPIKTPKKWPWYYWLIAALLTLILLFMIKNCQPQANIGEIQLLLNGYVINHEGSNDSTNFFSRGIFKETSIDSLDKKWEWFKFNNNDKNYTKVGNQGPEQGKNILFLSSDQLSAGKYLINLRVTDYGNKFKRWRKFDQQSVIIDIKENTSAKVTIPSRPNQPPGPGKKDIIKQKDIKRKEDPKKIPKLKRVVPPPPPGKKKVVPPPPGKKKVVPPPPPPPGDETETNVLKKEEISSLDNQGFEGWKQRTVIERKSINDPWKVIIREFIDPKGKTKPKLPKKLNKERVA